MNKGEEDREEALGQCGREMECLMAQVAESGLDGIYIFP